MFPLERDRGMNTYGQIGMREGEHLRAGTAEWEQMRTSRRCGVLMVGSCEAEDDDCLQHQHVVSDQITINGKETANAKFTCTHMGTTSVLEEDLRQH